MNTASKGALSIKEELVEGESKGKESQSEESSREGYKGAESIKLATGLRKVSETELPKVPEPAPQKVSEPSKNSSEEESGTVESRYFTTSEELSEA